MIKTGSGDNGELTFLDIIAILSFFIGLQNLDMNVTQEDAQKLQQQTEEVTERILSEIHTHLEEQDRKIDLILKRMEA